MGALTNDDPILEGHNLEDELAIRVRQQAAVADLGLRALGGAGVDALLDDAARTVAQTLDVDLAGIIESLPGGRIRFRAGVGWKDGIVGATVPAGPGSDVHAILSSSAPVVVDDVQSDPAPAALLAEHGVRSTAGVVIMGPKEPFGVLGAHSRTTRRFTRDDVAFLQSVANVVGQAVDRLRAEEATQAALEREREAVERLHSLNEMKNAFLEAVSHELRTPLSSVLGFALTLESRFQQLSIEEIRMVLGRLAVNARKLDRLPRDLLDLDRLYRRTIAPQRRPTELQALARSALEDVELGDHSVVVDGDPLTIDVDAPKVERVMENLLANSIKHTPPGSTTWIRAVPFEAGALIQVDDDGEGISDDLKDSVFDAFRRGPSASAHSPGAGIGLSLVARFAELHGGRAWVEDRPGGGARLCVYLPGEMRPTV